MGWAMIAMAAISAVQQHKAGQAAKEDAAFERQQLEEQAQLAKIDAVDQEASRRSQFAQAIASDIAMNAAANVENFLGSPQRLTDSQKSELDRDVSKIRLAGAAGVRVAELGATQTRRRGANAAMGGNLRAAGTIFSAASQAKKTA